MGPGLPGRFGLHFWWVIALNRPVDLATAEKMHQIFLEIIIAPSFDEDVCCLEQKKNLRLLQVDFKAPETLEPD